MGLRFLCLTSIWHSTIRLYQRGLAAPDIHDGQGLDMAPPDRQDTFPDFIRLIYATKCRGDELLSYIHFCIVPNIGV